VCLLGLDLDHELRRRRNDRPQPDARTAPDLRPTAQQTMTIRCQYPPLVQRLQPQESRTARGASPTAPRRTRACKVHRLLALA